MLFDRFDLWPSEWSHGLWHGWRCFHTGRKFVQYPVTVADLDTLPPTADVRLAGERWVRVAA